MSPANVETIRKAIKRAQRDCRQQAALRLTKRIESRILLELDEIVSGSESKKKDIPAIYFLLRKGAVVYVGQSKWVYDRLCQHIRLRRIPFDRYFILPCPSTELIKLESRYISKYQPFYNQQHKQGPGFLLQRITAAAVDGTV